MPTDMTFAHAGAYARGGRIQANICAQNALALVQPSPRSFHAAGNNQHPFGVGLGQGLRALDVGVGVAVGSVPFPPGLSPHIT